MRSKKDSSIRQCKTTPPDMNIYLDEAMAFILTECLNVNTHKHNALQLTFSKKDHFLRCLTSEGFVEGEIILIPPLVNHAFIENTGLVLVILIDEESILSESLKKSSIQSLDSSYFLEVISILSKKTDLIEVSKKFRQTKYFKTYVKSTIDDRIKKLITQVREDENFIPTAQIAAELCHLSESRFLHLFKEELGLPFRKYIQWARLKRALRYLEMGHSLTDIAHLAGFSDSSHLSRYFKDSFGLTPSEVIQNSQFIQVK